MLAVSKSLNVFKGYDTFDERSIQFIKRGDSLHLLTSSTAYYDATKNSRVLKIKVNSLAIEGAIFTCFLLYRPNGKFLTYIGMSVFA